METPGKKLERPTFAKGSKRFEKKKILVNTSHFDKRFIHDASLLHNIIP